MALKLGVESVMRVMVNRLVAISMLALLMQSGIAATVAGGPLPIQESPASGMHDPGDGGHGCPQGDCAPGQCDMSVGTDCCCLCTHAPLQVMIGPGAIAIEPAAIDMLNRRSSDTRRSVRPFRPPALA